MLGCHYLQRNDNKGFDFTVTVERHKPHSDGGFKQVDAFRISKDGAQKFYPLKGAAHFTITSPWTPREDESKADKSFLDNSDKYRQKYAWNLKFKLKSKVHEPWASSGIFTSVFAFLSCHVRLLFFFVDFSRVVRFRSNSKPAIFRRGEGTDDISVPLWRHWQESPDNLLCLVQQG